MALGLTRAQRDLLRILQELTGPDGVPPSYDELAREMCLASKGGISALVDGLVARGWIVRRKGCARSLEILGRVELPEDVEFVGLFDAPPEKVGALAVPA